MIFKKTYSKIQALLLRPANVLHNKYLDEYYADADEASEGKCFSHRLLKIKIKITCWVRDKLETQIDGEPASPTNEKSDWGAAESDWGAAESDWNDDTYEKRLEQERLKKIETAREKKREKIIQERAHAAFNIIMQKYEPSRTTAVPGRCNYINNKGKCCNAVLPTQYEKWNYPGEIPLCNKHHQKIEFRYAEYHDGIEGNGQPWAMKKHFGVLDENVYEIILSSFVNRMRFPYRMRGAYADEGHRTYMERLHYMLVIIRPTIFRGIPRPIKIEYPKEE